MYVYTYAHMYKYIYICICICIHICNDLCSSSVPKILDFPNWVVSLFSAVEGLITFRVSSQVAISTPQIRVSGSTKIRQQRSHWAHHADGWFMCGQGSFLGLFPMSKKHKQKERGCSILLSQYWTFAKASRSSDVQLWGFADWSQNDLHDFSIFARFKYLRKSLSKQRSLFAKKREIHPVACRWSHPATQVCQFFDPSVTVSIAGLLCRDAWLKRQPWCVMENPTSYTRKIAGIHGCSSTNGIDWHWSTAFAYSPHGLLLSIDKASGFGAKIAAAQLLHFLPR